MKKILVVDDEAAILNVLGDILEEAGYQVITAMDGLHGTMKAIQQTPDLILLDMSMPAGNGLIVLERLNNTPETQAIPVIIISVIPIPQFEKYIPKGRKVVFVQKPFVNKNLLDIIKAILK